MKMAIFISIYSKGRLTLRRDAFAFRLCRLGNRHKSHLRFPGLIKNHNLPTQRRFYQSR